MRQISTECEGGWTSYVGSLELVEEITSKVRTAGSGFFVIHIIDPDDSGHYFTLQFRKITPELRVIKEDNFIIIL